MPTDRLVSRFSEQKAAELFAMGVTGPEAHELCRPEEVSFKPFVLQQQQVFECLPFVIQYCKGQHDKKLSVEIFMFGGFVLIHNFLFFQCSTFDLTSVQSKNMLSLADQFFLQVIN